MLFSCSKKARKSGLFLFSGESSPAGRQAAKPPIGRRGLRGAEVLPPWLRGASLPQRKAPQGVKKARRRKRGTLWNADQNMVFTIIAKESTEGSPLFCFRKNCGGAADFSQAGGKPQSCRLGGGACGVRKSSRRGCVGQARRREKHRKGLKKPGGGCGVCFGTPPKKYDFYNNR